MELTLGIFIGSVITYFVVTGTKRNDYLEGVKDGEEAAYRKLAGLLDERE